LGDYRAVIFDFGGVISSSPVLVMRRFCESNAVPWESVRPLLGHEQGPWSRFETNAISAEEFVQELEAALATEGVRIDGAAFLKSFFGGMSMRPEMIAVVRALRQRPEMRVGCITNNVQGSRARNPLFDELFEVVVESSKVGMRKPDPRIYQIACEQLGVSPHQSIFLDDFGINLKAARALGMATIKVDETESAIDELERLLGFPLPRAAAKA
jgi:putative hydrolase of the HAD superfamily